MPWQFMIADLGFSNRGVVESLSGESGSWNSRFVVGGINPVFKVRAVLINCMALAAPSGCPMVPFMDPAGME